MRTHACGWCVAHTTGRRLYVKIRDGDDRTSVSRQISPANISRDSTSGVPDELNAIRFPENFRVTLSKTARS